MPNSFASHRPQQKTVLLFAAEKIAFLKKKFLFVRSKLTYLHLGATFLKSKQQAAPQVQSYVVTCSISVSHSDSFFFHAQKQTATKKNTKSSVSQLQENTSIIDGKSKDPHALGDDALNKIKSITNCNPKNFID